MRNFRSGSIFAAAILTAIMLTPGARADAALSDCGQPASTGDNPTATDCLFILQAAVGAQTCTPECICDTSGVGGISLSSFFGQNKRY